MSLHYWDSAAAEAVQRSLIDLAAKNQEERWKEYERYADFYDGRPDVICQKKYFKKRHRETDERYADRPKVSWPVCRAVVDAHAAALTGGSIKITLEDESSQEVWDGIAEHNNFDAYLNQIATTTGIYGSSGVKPYIHDDGTALKAIEFDHQPPDAMFFIYDANAGGRSVKRAHGVSIITGYDIENGTILPYPLDPKLDDNPGIQIKTELITKKQWRVWLDGRLTPVGPMGEMWMPSAKGENPWGEVMSTVYNGLETHMSWLGESDIVLAVHDNETVNHLWSDLIYMFRMYVPILRLKSDSKDSRNAFKAGIGAGVNININEDLSYIQALIDWSGVMEPVRIQLEQLYSNAKVPAAAVGLGHMFSQQTTAISGVAKQYEWYPTIQHAKAKRPPFTRGIQETVRLALTLAGGAGETEDGQRFGQGQSVDPDTAVTVEYGGDIVPTSKAEELERIGQEMLFEMTSAVSGMKQYHNWDNDRVAKELDMIKALTRSAAIGAGHKEIIDAVLERESMSITTDEKSKLFNPVDVAAFDKTTDDDATGTPAAPAASEDFAGLNGAQINAILEVLNNLAAGAIDEPQAKALVAAVGVPAAQVGQIVKKPKRKIEKIGSGGAATTTGGGSDDE